jgi:PQQ-dependent dehydrogenase (methanol/ethanol family)
MRKEIGWLIAAGLALAQAFGACAVAAQPTGNESEWSLVGGNAKAQHFSPLSQINASNAKHLGLAWYATYPSLDGPVGVPMVARGLVFESAGLGRVFANDLRTGKLVWSYDAHIHFPLHALAAWGSRLSRGVALWKSEVIMATGDCRLIALDQRTGSKIWQAQVCDPAMTTITAAPSVGGGEVFIGHADGDAGVGRGDVDAFDARTGKHLWRFYTMPGDPAHGFENATMAMAAKTWAPEYWKHAGGVSVWDSITYDPKLDQVYFGADGATPSPPPARGNAAGDELFSTCIIALNAKSGRLMWYYQTTPHDGWNYDATMPIVIADLSIGRARRRVIMEAPKNGFLYVLDARTGKLVNEPKPLIPINWASRIDMRTGRPVQLRAAKYWLSPGGAVVSPSPVGGHNWMPMAYSPMSGLVYVPVINMPVLMKVDPDNMGGGDVDWYYGLTHHLPFKGILVAWDPIRQRERWHVDVGPPYEGGTLATAGNVVFQGTTAGQLAAYRADTGERLWSMDVGSSILGAPSTVKVDATQLVLVAGGSGTTSALGLYKRLGGNPGGPARLFAFKLKGTAVVPVIHDQSAPFPQPTRPRPSAELVKAGSVIWDKENCEICHGFEARGGVGSVPDLRRSAIVMSPEFERVVIGGIFTPAGMPIFRGEIRPDQIEALRAYIVAQAWKAYDWKHSEAKHRAGRAQSGIARRP